MSYARFGWDGSDVYIFEHVGGFIQCCGCTLTNPEDGEHFGFANLKTAREALTHLDEHVKAGDHVTPRTFERIREEHPDLDAEIPPYVAPLEVGERFRELLRKSFEQNES